MGHIQDMISSYGNYLEKEKFKSWLNSYMFKVNERNEPTQPIFVERGTMINSAEKPKIQAASMYGRFGGYGMQGGPIIIDEPSMLYPGHSKGDIHHVITPIGGVFFGRQSGKVNQFLESLDYCTEDIFPQILSDPIVYEEFDPFVSGQRIFYTRPPKTVGGVLENIMSERYKLYPYPGRDGKCVINQRIRLKKCFVELKKPHRTNKTKW